MTTLEDLSRVTFPVVTVKDDWLSREASAVELRSCSEGAIEIKFHENLEIYDAGGLEHHVVSVSVIEGFWPNLKLTLNCWKHRALPDGKYVRFDLAKPHPYQFEDLRRTVMSTAEKAAVLRTETFFELYTLLGKWDPYLGWLR